MKRGGFAAMGTLACALMLAAALPAMAAPPSQAAEKTGDGPGVAETAKGTGEVRTDGDVPADAKLARGLDELLEPTWETDVACTTCHANLAEPDTSCLIAEHANIACAACHDDVATLEKLHEGAPVKEKEVKRLKKSNVGEELCLACHDREGLIEATAGLGLLTDDRGTTVNPHDLPNNEEHQGITCASCHYMHQNRLASELAKAKCNSCHHQGVYECFTCHA